MALGCYIEPYLPASYKGVGFRALATGSEHGRRGAEGEFPFGETTAYADLGRRIRRYSISARFDSNAHVTEAQLLISAVESVGPGVLVHPTRGVIEQAACTRLTVRDNPEEEQGVTYVDMEFVDANEFPNGLLTAGSVLGIALVPLFNVVRASFARDYTPTTIQTFREDAVVQAAQDQIASIADQYSLATVGQTEDPTRNRILTDLRSVAVSDVRAADTTTADRALSLGMTALAGQLDNQDQFDVFRNLANGAAMTSSFAAPAQTAENAVYNLVRTGSAIYMTEAAIGISGGLTNEVFEQADVIDAVLADEQLYARGLCDNELQLEIEKFRRDAATRLNAKAYTSPGLIEFEYGGATHPVVAAYEIYGDARRLREIETQNGVGRIGRVGPSIAGARVG